MCKLLYSFDEGCLKRHVEGDSLDLVKQIYVSNTKRVLIKCKVKPILTFKLERYNV